MPEKNKKKFTEKVAHFFSKEPEKELSEEEKARQLEIIAKMTELPELAKPSHGWTAAEEKLSKQYNDALKEYKLALDEFEAAFTPPESTEDEEEKPIDAAKLRQAQAKFLQAEQKLRHIGQEIKEKKADAAMIDSVSETEKKLASKDVDLKSKALQEFSKQEVKSISTINTAKNNAFSDAVKLYGTVDSPQRAINLQQTTKAIAKGPHAQMLKMQTDQQEELLTSLEGSNKALQEQCTLVKAELQEAATALNELLVGKEKGSAAYQQVLTDNPEQVERYRRAKMQFDEHQQMIAKISGELSQLRDNQQAARLLQQGGTSTLSQLGLVLALPVLLVRESGAPSVERFFSDKAGVAHIFHKPAEELSFADSGFYVVADEETQANFWQKLTHRDVSLVGDIKNKTGEQVGVTGICISGKHVKGTAARFINAFDKPNAATEPPTACLHFKYNPGRNVFSRIFRVGSDHNPDAVTTAYAGALLLKQAGRPGFKNRTGFTLSDAQGRGYVGDKIAEKTFKVEKARVAYQNLLQPVMTEERQQGILDALAAQQEAGELVKYHSVSKGTSDPRDIKTERDASAKLTTEELNIEELRAADEPILAFIEKVGLESAMFIFGELANKEKNTDEYKQWLADGSPEDSKPSTPVADFIEQAATNFDIYRNAMRNTQSNEENVNFSDENQLQRETNIQARRTGDGDGNNSQRRSSFH